MAAFAASQRQLITVYAAADADGDRNTLYRAPYAFGRLTDPETAILYSGNHFDNLANLCDASLAAPATMGGGWVKGGQRAKRAETRAAKRASLTTATRGGASNAHANATPAGERGTGAQKSAPAKAMQRRWFRG